MSYPHWDSKWNVRRGGAVVSGDGLQIVLTGRNDDAKLAAIVSEVRQRDCEGIDEVGVGRRGPKLKGHSWNGIAGVVDHESGNDTARRPDRLTGYVLSGLECEHGCGNRPSRPHEDEAGALRYDQV